MKELLSFIIKSIVDKVKEVKIEETENNPGEVVLNLSVAQEDMGKVIGKEGKIIKAIRTIMRVYAIKNNKRVLLNLEDKVIKTPQTDQPVLSADSSTP